MVQILIQPLVTDNSPALAASEPVYALPLIEVGGASGYAPQFYGYSTGMEFLNSVHAKFTGNFQQINDHTKYTSSFSYGTCDLNGYSTFDQSGCESVGGVWTDAFGCKFNQTNCEANTGLWTPLQGTCTTCHDVHVSTVAAVNATAPYKNTCPDCHISEANMASIKHPQGAGTPLGDLSNVPSACAKCHMPKPNNGVGRSAHVWRINTSATYTTFPTSTQWNAGQKTAFTAAAGAYANATWIDIDLACGQCHNGSGPAQHYFSKTTLAGRAAGMHAGSPWPTGCTNCHSGGGDPTAPQISQGVDHHTGSCETCHTQPGRAQFGSSNDSCLICHSTTPAGTTLQGVAEGTNHHSGACMTCHTTPGVTQFTTTVASCLSCHSVAQGTKQPVSMATLNHPSSGGTPKTCAACHTEPGVPVNTVGLQVLCGQCHGGSLGPGATQNNAPYFGLPVLTAFANGMHPVVKPVMTTAPTALNGPATTNGWTVSFTDRSTFDSNATAAFKIVTVNWGDGSAGVITAGTATSHTYSNSRVRSYTVTQTVTDTVHPVSRTTFKVSVPQKYTVSGTTVAGARVYLKLNGHIRQSTVATVGAFSFSNVLPGSYTIRVYKVGSSFTDYTINNLSADVTGINIPAN